MVSTVQQPEVPMLCRACGYRLDCLESRRCPECGLAFDPDDPRSVRFSLRRVVPTSYILAYALVFIPLFAALLLLTAQMCISSFVESSFAGRCAVAVVVLCPIMSAAGVEVGLFGKFRNRRRRDCVLDIGFALNWGYSQIGCGMLLYLLYYLAIVA